MYSFASIDKRRLAKEFIRFTALGFFTVSCMLLLYLLLRFLLPEVGEALEASIAWFISYAVTSVLAHYVHRRFTFGSDAPYMRSLVVAITVYSVTLLTSTVAMYLVVDLWNGDDLITALLLEPTTGILNFLGLRVLAFKMGFAPQKQAVQDT